MVEGVRTSDALIDASAASANAAARVAEAVVAAAIARVLWFTTAAWTAKRPRAATGTSTTTVTARTRAAARASPPMASVASVWVAWAAPVDDDMCQAIAKKAWALHCGLRVRFERREALFKDFLYEFTIYDVDVGISALFSFAEAFALACARVGGAAAAVIHVALSEGIQEHNNFLTSVPGLATTSTCATLKVDDQDGLPAALAFR